MSASTRREASADERAASPKKIALGSIVLVAALGAAGDVGAGPPSLFQRVKDKENAAALPKDSAEIVLGAIDCDSGVFRMGAFPTSTTDVGGGGYNTVQRITRHAVGAFAKHVRMRLDATNRKGRRLSASLSFGASAQNRAGGLVNPKAASEGADSVTFDIGESAGHFTFAVQCGDAVASGPRLVNDGQPSTGYVDRTAPRPIRTARVRPRIPDARAPRPCRPSSTRTFGRPGGRSRSRPSPSRSSTSRRPIARAGASRDTPCPRAWEAPRASRS